MVSNPVILWLLSGIGGVFMDVSWCRRCGADVSLAHAVAELPCPKCGAVEYTVIVDSGERDALLSKAERMQRLGRWEDATSIFADCLSGELISLADFNLSMTELKWRREAAAFAAGLVDGNGGSLPVERFRQRMEAEYDQFVAQWLLREYQGVHLASDGNSSVVEVS